MLWYVFYRTNPFESPHAMKFNRGTAARAEAAAQRELADWGGGEILYTLPGEQVCPSCWHPWDQHTALGCQHKGASAVDGVLHKGIACPCRKKPRH